jgi:hypothetical protein
MAMDLGEYITLVEEMSIVDKIDSKKEEKLTMEQQIKMIQKDPAIRKR